MESNDQRLHPSWVFAIAVAVALPVVGVLAVLVYFASTLSIPALAAVGLLGAWGVWRYRQVGRHLDAHLSGLPADSPRSLAQARIPA